MATLSAVDNSSFSPAYLVILPEVIFQPAGTVTLSLPPVAIVALTTTVFPAVVADNTAKSSAENVMSLATLFDTLIVQPASRIVLFTDTNSGEEVCQILCRTASINIRFFRILSQSNFVSAVFIATSV